MRIGFAAGLAACALCHAGLALAAQPANRAPHPRASLEGVWTSNFILTMEATPRTPKLVVPEAEAKTLAVVVGGEVSKVFENTLDAEAPADIAARTACPSCVASAVARHRPSGPTASSP